MRNGNSNSIKTTTAHLLCNSGNTCASSNLSHLINLYTEKLPHSFKVIELLAAELGLNQVCLLQQVLNALELW